MDMKATRLALPLVQKVPTPKRFHLQDEEDEDIVDVFLPNINHEQKSRKWQNLGILVTIVLSFCIWLISGISFVANTVKVPNLHHIIVAHSTTKGFFIQEAPSTNLKLTLKGAFLPSCYNNSQFHLETWIEVVTLHDDKINDTNIKSVKNISGVWKVALASEELLDVAPALKRHETFELFPMRKNYSGSLLRLQFSTNLKTDFPISIRYNLQPINTNHGIIYGALLLVVLYIVIGFEIMDRTLAAMLATTTSIAILAALDARPSLAEIISWVDMEAISLLLSMMVIVSILSETGLFNYMSVIAYRMTGGKIWPLINSLCVTTAILSCFLDNVTTVLLITPVTIKLCEVSKLNPVPVLIYQLIFSNIGGAITPIGDPPNVIIASNPKVVKSGVNFGVFTLHMGFGALLTLCLVYMQLRYLHRNLKKFKFSDPSPVPELRHEIAVLQRAAASISSYSNKEEVVKETLLKRSNTLTEKLMTAVNTSSLSNHNFSANLQELKHKFPIQNRALLIYSIITLSFVISIFFLHSLPAFRGLGLGLIAFLGALLLMILYGRSINGVLMRIEWPTLIFFACLFIMMEALAKLGLIEWVGVQTQTVIMSVKQESRLTVAVILMLWVSGIASAFVDNLPLTTMMIRIATNLADSRELGLPLQPLVWALSFGACFGGNGSLFGSTSNIVCAGIADQHGYKFTFIEFIRVGLPVMFSSLLVVSVYLIVCHVVFCWH